VRSGNRRSRDMRRRAEDAAPGETGGRVRATRTRRCRRDKSLRIVRVGGTPHALQRGSSMAALPGLHLYAFRRWNILDIPLFGGLCLLRIHSGGRNKHNAGAGGRRNDGRADRCGRSF